MNCDECIERVFELIEEEASDPARVRAILEQCPDCRALFEETKTSLALAAELPLEDPPAALDAAIRRAAEEKVGGAAKSKPPWVPRAPHWAMAAVAVLAVGLGLWSRPRSVQMEEELPSEYGAATERELLADQAEPEALAPRADEALREIDLAQAPAAQGLPGGAPEAKPAEQAPQRAPAPRKTSTRDSLARNDDAAEKAPALSTSDVQEAAAASPARTGLSDGRQAASKGKRERKGQTDGKKAASPPVVVAELEAADAVPDSPASAEETEAREEASLRICRQLVAAQSRRDERARDKPAEAPEPREAEAQLRLGRCYRQLGEREKARVWLERAEQQPATRERASAELRALADESN